MSDQNKISILNKYPMVSGVIDRLALAGVAYIASKGFITVADVPFVGDYLEEIISGGLIVVIGMYQNRKAALAESATTIAPGTKVVTVAEVANELPSANIVSCETNAVVKK